MELVNTENVMDRSVFRTGYQRPVDLKRLAFIHRYINQEKPHRVLELGCGDGNVLMSLNGVPDVVGVEIYEPALAVAKKRGLNVVAGDARTFQDGTKYDVVIASEVICYFINPLELIVNIGRNLYPGGTLILTCPNGFGPWELKTNHLNLIHYAWRSNILRRLLGRKPYISGVTLDTHAQWFTRRSLLTLTAKGGFILLEQENSDFLTGGRWDIKLASMLPFWAASGWFFAFRYDPDAGLGTYG